MATKPLDLRNTDTIRRTPNRRLIKRPWFWAALALVVVLAVAGLIFRHFLTKPQSDVNTVIKRVDRHYILPANETPALATITDKSKVTTPFLKQAQNGDQILIYQKNQIAIVYRPSADRIVSVGPVTIDTPPGQPQP